MTAASHRTDWMSRGRFGIMVHWIAPGPAPERGEWIQDLDRALDRFDLDRFVSGFQASGADWLIFTIGQNTACYASPNRTLERWAGPGHCSKRDLVLEIARSVHEHGKRFIAYLPAEVNAPAALHQAFAWDPDNATGDQVEFQRRYTSFYREYAERYGKLLDGWWFDGCYPWAVFPNGRYDWPMWADSARAGNPDALLAFNDGSFCVGNTRPLTPLQDYLSGEVEVLKEGKIRLGRGESAPLYLPESRFVAGTACQWHALVPIDCFWGHATPGPMEPPRYSDDELFSFVRSCRAVGGAVTLNVGIYQDGGIGETTLGQLQRLAAALKRDGPGPAAA